MSRLNINKLGGWNSSSEMINFRVDEKPICLIYIQLFTVKVTFDVLLSWQHEPIRCIVIGMRELLSEL